MPQVTLRPVTPQDTEKLFEIFCASHPEYNLLPLPEPKKGALIRTQFQMQSADYRGRFPDSLHQIILADGVPVGRIWVAEIDELIILLDIGILDESRNSGIGSEVVKTLQQQARASGKVILTSVLRSNMGSLRWHLRLGFRICREDEVFHHLEWEVPAP